MSTSVAMNVTPNADNASFSYSDVDIFLSYSDDFGASWQSAGNITNTPSGYDDAGNYISRFELHPHLTPNTMFGNCYMTFQVPAMPKPPSDVDWGTESYELVKNYIYYGKFGNSSGYTPSGSITINEIMQNPGSVSDSNGEWFELYNPGIDTINIAGWTIKDSGGDLIEIDSTCCVTTIPPSSFYVL